MQPGKRTPDFVHDFVNCLQNSKWLPHIKHPLRARHTDTKKLCGANLFVFDVSVGSKKSVGHLEITPEREDGLLHVFYIASELKGLGNEILRRVVEYGRKNRFSKIDASSTTYEKAASFWLYSGFRSEGVLYPNWDCMKATHSTEVDLWQERVQKDIYAYCELAGTEIGRRVLSDVCFRPVLDFKNEKQCSYVAARLMLPRLRAT